MIIVDELWIEIENLKREIQELKDRLERGDDINNMKSEMNMYEQDN